MLGLWRPLCGVFWRGNIGIAIRAQNAVAGLQMAFTAVLCFGLSPALPDMGAKMPPAGPWRAHASGGDLVEGVGI